MRNKNSENHIQTHPIFSSAISRARLLLKKNNLIEQRRLLCCSGQRHQAEADPRTLLFFPRSSISSVTQEKLFFFFKCENLQLCKEGILQIKRPIRSMCSICWLGRHGRRGRLGNWHSIFWNRRQLFLHRSSWRTASQFPTQSFLISFRSLLDLK